MEENEVLTDKEQFIRNHMVSLYAQLKGDERGQWGKMNAQQMVEHMSDFVKLASGQYNVEPVHPPELTQKLHTFMMSEKPFRENTPNPTLPGEPQALKNASMEEAINELRREIEHFFAVYQDQPGLRNLNPIFGNLSYREQVQLLHKHGMHHARQFGLVN